MTILSFPTCEYGQDFSGLYVLPFLPTVPCAVGVWVLCVLYSVYHYPSREFVQLHKVSSFTFHFGVGCDDAEAPVTLP